MASTSKGVQVALCASMCAVFLFYCILLIHMPTVVVDSRNEHKLIVILLDGFGRDQLRHLIATSDENCFTTMASRGVHAEYLRPIFPTMTQPNHYALMTGMYAEDHGVVHDTLYDRRTGEEFRFDKKPALWLPKEAEPLWMTVERNGKRVHLSTTQCHTSVPVLNISASCIHNTSTDRNIQLSSLADNLKNAFDRVAIGDNVLAVVHTPFVHEVIHEHGPISVETEEAVENVDQILRIFLNDVNDLQSKINVMVVSEVGLAPVSNKKPVLIDSSLVLNNVVKTIGGGAHFCLWPVAGMENDVMEALLRQDGIRAQTKTNSHMLEKFHYRKHDLIAPIHIVADDGYFIQLDLNATNHAGGHHHGTPKGLHGYDPFHVDDMKAIFYAQGPQFETNSRVAFIRAPNVYDIARNVLRLDHHPRQVDSGILKKLSQHHH